ncbi:helical backbone metal receptor [Kineosporia sp. R_H_3]|uniref:helical backbone metal receptor n=1 Tax=Kineosporia sp. R_H_3 TaxID=1961848 RepID=UPI000B4B3933|nr:helical backbone metal receptor [Kineosporia sp. R_H_3]
MRSLVDDTGREVVVPDDVTRVVSIVPSLTESVAATAAGLLVAATDWCTHPADLDVVRVRGTKNPDVARIVDLTPDLVLANAEENRDPDLDLLRAAGVAVWVTDIRTVSGAHPALGPAGSLARMLDACGLVRPGWLDEADAAWAAARPATPRRRALVPIWRRPWMAVGRDTFTGDVLARLGVDNALADDPERYPKVDLDGLAGRAGGFDLVVLPDEPYLFTADDGPEAFPGVESVLVPGRLLTWYGPSLVEAARELPGLLGAAGR